MRARHAAVPLLFLLGIVPACSGSATSAANAGAAGELGSAAAQSASASGNDGACGEDADCTSTEPCMRGVCRGQRCEVSAIPDGEVSLPAEPCARMRCASGVGERKFTRDGDRCEADGLCTSSARCLHVATLELGPTGHAAVLKDGTAVAPPTAALRLTPAPAAPLLVTGLRGWSRSVSG